MTRLLEIAGLNAWYGESQVLRGVTLALDEGEVVVLAGRNGSGRSTLAKAVMGLVRKEGTVRFRGRSIAALPTHAIARLGLGYVPEQRDVFPGLTVRENLILGLKPGKGRSLPPDVLRLFPVLQERASVRAGALSGGEQQMLSLARTLAGDPSLVIIDEPTEGLAPHIVALVAECLAALRTRGVAILLIEQRASLARELATRVAVMGHGRIVFDGSPEDFAADSRVQGEWLSLG
ncbi:ABC transporter ATP-binding protein [Burkholderia sp. Leaf177]|uniref:ABC transporter ATP-binding protein n=1 Tax=Burkholderia sp. Leaf177 TaxID=1736287 RepID=UPI0006FDCAE1|nr:ABC transporter ATP-binding protein [Burkholderia sp. Leaf177]KQR86036.1 ABC transporter ATP-binding protein [Burkholderia sp. Leaf177]